MAPTVASPLTFCRISAGPFRRRLTRSNISSSASSGVSNRLPLGLPLYGRNVDNAAIALIVFSFNRERLLSHLLATLFFRRSGFLRRSFLLDLFFPRLFFPRLFFPRLSLLRRYFFLHSVSFAILPLLSRPSCNSNSSRTSVSAKPSLFLPRHLAAHSASGLLSPIPMPQIRSLGLASKIRFPVPNKYWFNSSFWLNLAILPALTIP